MKISIITPVYNGAKYLEETILSVINQNYNDVEYIIVDGGSTDGTIEIIKKYEDRLAFWVSEPDRGMYDAIYKGFKYVTGDICAYINSDDIYPQNAFSTVVSIFKQNSNIKWLRGMGCQYSSNSVIVNASRPLVNNRNDIKNFFSGSIMQESMFWRRELNATVNWDKFITYKLAGDHYIWTCFATVADLYVVNAIIGGHRKHPGQLSENMEKYMEEIYLFAPKKNIYEWIRFKYKILIQKLVNDRVYKKKSKGLFLTWNSVNSKFE